MKFNNFISSAFSKSGTYICFPFCLLKEFQSTSLKNLCSLISATPRIKPPYLFPISLSRQCLIKLFALGGKLLGNFTSPFNILLNITIGSFS